MIWPPPGDHDPALVQRAQEALRVTAAGVVADLTDA